MEGNAIVEKHHKSAVIILIKRLSKVIITLKLKGKHVINIEMCLNSWLKSVFNRLFKFITFDCYKKLSNWKSISNSNDIDIYFADHRTTFQQVLNENLNGLYR